MYKIENALLGPNMLGVIIQEEEQSSQIDIALFRETTNLRKLQFQDKEAHQRHGWRSVHQVQQKSREKDLKQEFCKQNQCQFQRVSQLGNLLNVFDSSEYIQQNQNDGEEIKNSLNYQLQSFQTPQQHPSNKSIKINKKNGFLLDIDFEEDSQLQQKPGLFKVQAEQAYSKEGQQNLNHQNSQIQSNISFMVMNTFNNTHQLFKIQEKKQCLLNLSFTEEDPSQKVEQLPKKLSKQQSDNKKLIVSLSFLVKRFGNKYYLAPIPEGAVLQCVVKRDCSQSTVKYQFYDCYSLRNFMTVIKDSDGFLFISKLDNTKAPGSEQKSKVIGRMVSNFFGTQFNCLLEDIPYQQSSSYPVNKTAQHLITVEYEANLFGLNGPRKLAAYISKQSQQRFQPLNQIYQRQKKKKLKTSVLKFKNKTPIWREQASACALHFKGRATVSSKKNFMMIGQQQSENSIQKVLFGKFGRQLYNLDVRYPFSLIQGIVLAVSSFDRKITCQ